MRNFHQSRTCIFSLVLISTGMLIGCEQTPPANNPSTVTPEKKPVTAEDVQRETAEAAQATKEYLGEKKDEFAKEMNKKMEALDAQMADMKVEGEKLKGEAKVKWDAVMEELKLKRAEMSEKLEELKKSSGPAWEDLKAGLEKAGHEIDSAAEEALKKIKGEGADDSPDTSNNP